MAKKLAMKLRKSISMLLAVLMVFSVITPVSAAPVEPTESCAVCGSFADVETDRWYHEALDYVIGAGLMNGVSDTEFAPDDDLVRAQFVTILWRAAGEPEVDAKNNYPDVEEGRYYTKAVLWATQEGFVNGYTNGKFGVNDSLTREQMATILWRVAGEPEAEAELTFDDAADVSNFAKVAVQWAVAEGLLQGYKNKLEPADTATRAEVAQVLVRYLNAEEPDEPVELTKLTPDMIPATDPMKGIQTPITGYYELDVTVGESTRTAKLYIPENAKYGAYSVFLNIPAGADATAFLKDTGWMAAADAENFFIFAVEAGEGSWKAEDADYIKAAFASLKSNTYFRPHSSCFYVVGYGEGGRLMQEFAIANTLSVGAAAFIDASGIEAETLATLGAGSSDGNKTKVTCAELPLPAWIYSSDELDAKEKAVIDYYLAANECAEEATKIDDNTVSYMQKADSDCKYTAGDVISKVIVQEGGEEPTAAEIYDFLDGYLSYGNWATGWCNGQRVDYEEIGAETVIFNQTYKGVEAERQYILYVPESVKKAEEGTVPVVLVAPGAGSSDTFMFDTSMWWKVADEEGIIIACMTAIPGKAGSKIGSIGWDSSESKDLVYVDAIVDQVTDNPLVDESKIYISGQSAGCAFTQHVASNRAYVFAAAAATSGPMYRDVPVTDQKQIPFFMLIGEGDHDSWNYYEDGKVREQLQYWVAINQTSALDEPDVEDEVLSDGHYEISKWFFDAKYPVLQFGKTYGRGHSAIADECNVMWDYLKQWTLVDGARYYNGEKLPAAGAYDLDKITELPYDCSEAAQLPLTGYYTKEVMEGRSVKVYISEDASIRSYFTVVAVPDGVDTYAFLEEEGWFDVADEKGEGLLVMEPGEDGWGTVAQELKYVTAAMNFFKSGSNANKVSVFSGYGEFYFVGYGAACAPLEAYAADYPIFVISQVYIDGEGAGQIYLDSNGAETYDGKNTGGYDPIPSYKEDLALIGADVISKSEVPVPTWFAGYELNDYSIGYWKAANDVVATPEAGVYRQDINSDAMQTNYANKCLKEEGAEYGIAEVVVNDDVDADAAAIYAWLSTFTRYDNTFAYSNALGYRLDYTAATVEAQQEFKTVTKPETLEYTKTGGEKGIAEVYSQASVEVGNGEVVVGIMAFADNAKDGVDESYDPREYLLYIPESAKEAGEEGAPVVIVWPGNTQSDRIFMDSTMWWKIADKEGFVLAFVCETYNASSVSISHADSDLFYYALSALLEGQISEDFVKIDMNRVYSTGQSAGSMTSQGFGRSNPEFFAAIASTSGAIMGQVEAANEYIPSYLIIGQSDLGFLMPDLWGADQMVSWAEYLFEVNGIEADINNWTSADTDSRFHTYTWENAQGVPMVVYGETQLRTHNCYPEEMGMLWDYMKHFSFDRDENGYVTARYYSESAFAEDDAVVIENPAQVAADAEELQEAVVSIQATTAPNFYGHKVETVVITFEEDVDAAKLAAADFTLYDRGFQAPYFGEVEIVDVQVAGNVVTLTIDQGSDKTADRSRDTFGTLCTSSNWFIDSEGNIYAKKAGVDELGITINPNTIGKGLQRRNLDLILCINGTDITEGIKSTDGKGNMLEDTVWQETILGGGLDEVEQLMINVGWEAADYTMINKEGEAFVPVDVIWPENYDAARAEKYPVIFYQCGGGVCYWENLSDKLIAPANNRGCNVVYDNMMTEWHKLMPEAIIISVNVHSSGTVNSAKEIIAVLEYFVANYNADVDKIVGVGNSQGTIITSDVIRQRPDLIAAYIPCNGDFGGMASSAEMNETLENSTMKSWTKEEVQAVIDNEVAVWMNNGETDGNNPAGAQDITAILSKMYAEAGKTDEWIFNHVRLSGYQSWQFKLWGETDHSVTKVVAWKYLANAYTDVIEGEEPLAPGSKYMFTGKEAGFKNYPYTMDFEYTVYEESISEWVANLWAGVYDEQDLDDITSVPMEFNEAAQLPLTGYFTKNVAEGRSVKVYISEDASIRSYFTVVAVPDGVDTEEFLEAEGWFDVADAKGEGLFVMEPGEEGWGTVAQELKYVTEAMNFFKSGRNANGVTCFSVFGEFYFVGYGAACAPLEAYAAEYPIFVISQAYIDGEGAGQTYLDANGTETYDGKNTGGYPAIDNYKESLAAIGADVISKSEVPVPTWFAGYAEGDYSISYWKAANDVVATTEMGVYRQDINSDAMQTNYANKLLKEEGSEYGISEVIVNDDVEADAAAIYAWLSTFTRYDNTFAYSNALGYRLDYTAATVEAQQAAKAATEYGTLEYTKTGGEKGTAELWSQASVKVGDGEMIVGVMAFADNKNDGEDESYDPREYMIYVPDSAKNSEAAPVVMVYPGNSQTDRIFMDATMWWKEADQNGFVVVIICETYNKNAVSVSHYDSDLFYYALKALLAGQISEDYVQIDMNRIYGTGQSAGSNATQGFAYTNPEFFAAVASTSAAPNKGTAVGYIPSYLITGQSDIANMVPDLWNAASLPKWAAGLLEVNGLADIYNWTSASTEGRFHTYAWENAQGIAMVQWGQTLLRSHNCYPEEMGILWDFMKNFSVETDENGYVIARYYSESAFAEDDKIEIVNPAEVPDLDDITSNLAVDYSQASQLPLTGYFTKTVSEGRTVKVYISEEAGIRSYFTVVAVPDGVDTYEFLEAEGWIAQADERGECLFVLEPGAEGWGTQAEEEAYVNAAMAFLGSGRNSNKVSVFSTFGVFYLVGYGAGAAPLEAWAAVTPIKVIAQAYVDGEGLGAEYLAMAGEKIYDGSKSGYGDITDKIIAGIGEENLIKGKEIPVPTYFAAYGEDSIAYWKQANDCVAEAADDAVYGKVYAQAADSTAWATAANGNISKVAVGEKAAAGEDIAAFLYAYTRYDNSTAYGDSLGVRLDYTGARVAAQLEAKDGEVKETVDGVEIWGKGQTEFAGLGTVEVGVVAFKDNSGDGKFDPREYITFVPEGYEDEQLPVLFVWAGGSQTDVIFFDATAWWKVAAEEGFIVVVPAETYGNNATGVGHKDTTEFYNAMLSVLGDQVDASRIYTTGQSAGSATSTGYAQTNPEMFAAVASTSGIVVSEDPANEMIPLYTIFGMGDVDRVPTLFNDVDGEKMDQWAGYMLQANGLGAVADNVMTQSGRYTTYTWTNFQGIELFKIGETAYRAHNCYPAEMAMLWDYLEHFSFAKDENGNVTRYYSASAFEEDDAVEIFKNEDDQVAPVSLDGVAAPTYDYSDANQLPMTGYFSKTLSYGDGEEREVLIYIPEEASVRPYFHVIAVPNDVDPTDFLLAQGWFDLADENGECLYVVLPGEGGWGAAEEEMPYMNKALSWLNTPVADEPDPAFPKKNKNYWSAFGVWYFVGYGEGCAALEAWAAVNPIFVISQVYVDGTSAGGSYLQQAGATTYAVGTNGYDISADVQARLEALGEKLLVKKDVPVPTWFVGYDVDDYSVQYWKEANDCVSNGAADAVYGSVYAQAEDSNAWQTQYAGSISKVAVSFDTEVTGEEIYDFLTYYTRYDNTSVYGNSLMLRGDYTDVVVACHQSEDLYAEMEVTMPDGVKGTMICTVVEVKGEPREFLFYIPETAEELQENGAPVITVWAGGSQTSIIFFDSTCWWETANKNGVALIFAAEAYNTSVAITPKECYACYDTMIDMLKGWDEEGKFDFDFTRLYSTGQSMGSMESQQFAQEAPEMYAAVASTSFYSNYADTQSGKPIPTYLLNGEGNGKADSGTPFDDRWNNTDQWAQYFLNVNGFEYQDPTYDAEGNMVELGVPVSEYEYTVFGDYDRFETYTWSDENNVPLVKYTNSLYRPHNCLTTETPIMWDFLEHFSSVVEEDGSVTRYYSESAFAEDDAIKILEFADPMQEEVVSIQATTIPNYYGHKVGTVEITFADDVDAAALAAAEFTVWDRGSANPEFGKLEITDVAIEGNVVTLSVDQGTDRTGDRSRNSFGVLNTTGWYADSEGNIYCGKTAGRDALGMTINPNKANKTAWTRELDLILCINDTDITKGIMSTDGIGTALEDTVWEPTIKTALDDEVELFYIDAGETNGFTQIGDGDGKVPAFVIFPENYDPENEEQYELIFYQCGSGVAYWELAAGESGNIAPANNLGCNVVYDNMMTELAENMPNAIILGVHVRAGSSATRLLASGEVIQVLEYAIDNWNVDPDKIAGVGNSFGTVVVSEVIRKRPDLVAAFVECNGSFGNHKISNADVDKLVKVEDIWNILKDEEATEEDIWALLEESLANSTLWEWTDEEIGALLQNEVALWMFNGETDTTGTCMHQNLIETLRAMYQMIGKSEEWALDHLRVSGLPSPDFKAWGETDHSATKNVAWYYIDGIYNPDLDGDGIYSFNEISGKEEGYQLYWYSGAYEYTVYPETVAEWLQDIFAEQNTSLEPVA